MDAEDFKNMRHVNPVEQNLNTWDNTDIQTYMEILQSESLIERVLDKLNDGQPEELSSDTGRVSAWRKALNLSEPEMVDARTAALEMAAGSLTVRATGETRIVEILADSTDPKVAAEFANTLISEFVDRNLDARWQTTQHTSEWLTRQLEEMRIKLERSEGKLQSYARRTGLLYTSGQNNVAEERLRQLQEALSQAQADRITRQSRHEMVSSSPLGTLPYIVDDSSLRDYQAKLTDLRRQEAELSTTYTPVHSKVKRVQAQMRTLETALNDKQEAIIGRIRNEYEEAVRREKLLATDYANQVRLLARPSTVPRGAVRFEDRPRSVHAKNSITGAGGKNAQSVTAPPASGYRGIPPRHAAPGSETNSSPSETPAIHTSSIALAGM